MERKEKEEKEMVRRANDAVMERQRFAIDEVVDEDDDAAGGGGDDDDGVMDEVEACKFGREASGRLSGDGPD